MPEAEVMEVGGAYYGAFRLFEGEYLRIVLENKRKKRFTNATDALTAAKTELKRRINGRITGYDVTESMASESLDVKKRAATGTIFLKGRQIRVEMRNGRKG
jgi:hypothetical protein